MPRTHVGFHCNANEKKTEREKGNCMLLKLVTRNGQLKTGNRSLGTAVTRLRIQHGGQNDVNTDTKEAFNPHLQCN